MDGLRSYMVRLGSLELATVIFWMLFWLANGLAKLIPGVHIGVKFAEKGNPFGGALDKMGWGTGLGEFAYYFTGVFELIVGIIFLWTLIQFIMRSGTAARRPWILFGLFLSAIIFAVFTFQNVVTASRPTPLIWHVTYFAIVGVSWLVIVGQGYWASATSEDG
ncbi:MAG: hypothetical protein F4Y63_06380 [Chloroflexi bacterium]|nr:hypothetical protein [Chloroflexota bacterium]MYK61391.1 hypothetical protein [Chloroflexota bacterium]